MRFLIQLLFPNRCLNCQRLILREAVICNGCFRFLNQVEYPFGKGGPLQERCKLLFPVTETFALFYFEKEGLAQKIIHELKYNGRQKIGKTLAEWALKTMGDDFRPPDVLATVPLHPKKQRKRGYNQLHLFADTLSKNLEIPHRPQLLRRNIYRAAQAKKNREQRGNTELLFTLAENVSGMHVLLIDDVFTTGNTMSAAAWAILKGGATVSVLVIALDV